MCAASPVRHTDEGFPVDDEEGLSPRSPQTNRTDESHERSGAAAQRIKNIHVRDRSRAFLLWRIHHDKQVRHEIALPAVEAE
jgi:hypothetical protein